MEVKHMNFSKITRLQTQTKRLMKRAMLWIVIQWDQHESANLMDFFVRLLLNIA